MDVTAIIIIVILILLNGWFVAAEFAIIGAPRLLIERQAAEGSRAAQRVLSILRDPVRQDRYIATAQLGITSASLALGMYGEHLMAEWIATKIGDAILPAWLTAHAIASVIAVTILTYFHIVIGEMVPKSIALQYAERTSMLITPPMLVVQMILYPFVLGLNVIGNALLRVAGIRRQEGHSEQYHTSEELQLVVRESEEEGLLGSGSAEMLEELFEFGQLTAGEVKVPRVRVTGIPLGADGAAVTDILTRLPHTRYPIYDGDLDHIVGAMHIRDLLRKSSGGGAVTIADCTPVPHIPESLPLDSVLRRMREWGIQMAVVLDEHGGTSGVVTLEDLFEEVVGEISEGTTDPLEIYRDAEGILHVAGTARIEEVGKWLDRVMEHEDVDSVSGLVLALLGRPPVVGDTVTYAGVTLMVQSIEGHGVRECVVVVRE